MIRLLHPLDNKTDFVNITDLLLKCLKMKSVSSFLSYFLIKLDKKTIESMIKNHRENGIDYIVYDTNDLFLRVLALKKKINSRNLNCFFWLLTETIRKKELDKI